MQQSTPVMSRYRASMGRVRTLAPEEELALVLKNCELIKVEQIVLKLVLQGVLVIYGTTERTIICGLKKSEKAKEGE